MQGAKHIQIADRCVMGAGERKKLAILKIADKLSATVHKVRFIFAFVAGSNILLQVKWKCSEDSLR